MNLRPPPSSAPAPGWDEPTRDTFDLVRRSQAGDHWAFGALQEQFYLPVMKFVRVWFDHQQDAEDVTMDVFVNLFQALPGLKNARRFVGFLFGVARNTCSRELQRRRGHKIEEVPLEAVAGAEESSVRLPTLLFPGADETFRRKEARRDLARGLGRLPAEERQALLLFVQERFSYPQISQMLHIPPETARNRVRSARRHLVRDLPTDFGL